MISYNSGEKCHTSFNALAWAVEENNKLGIKNPKPVFVFPLSGFRSELGFSLSNFLAPNPSGSLAVATSIAAASFTNFEILA
jgi:hypothetical protein